MIKEILLILIMATPLYAAGPQFRHKDPIQQQEFENVYKDIRRISSRGGQYVDLTSAQTVGGVKSFSNQSLFSDGSPSAPSISFNNDVDMGFYRDSANTLAYGVGGNKHMSLSNTLILHNGQLRGWGGASAVEPSFSFEGDENTGMYSVAADVVGIAANGNIMAAIADGEVQFFNGSGVYPGTGVTFKFNNTQLEPQGAGSRSTGNATNYWNDISYKTLTDRGCLGWFDDGVEMPDGSIVSDLEACSFIKMHPEKKTIYGKPMLDYKSFPKVAYKKASYDEDGETKYFPRDKKDEPFYWEVTDSSGNVKQVYTEEKPDKKAKKKFAADGVEMTSMFSIMIGALKEAHQRIEVLEEKVAKLESR